jgi:tRNA(Ile)-lysidine synthase
LRALHVDHGLQPAHTVFAAAARGHAEALGIPFLLLPVTVSLGGGVSPEAAAREARYAALAASLVPGEALLVAHHRDDQAETLLLQLLRGAGPHGLAAMPAVAPLGQGRLLRPLLGLTRAEIRAYAEGVGLTWLEDPMNADPRYPRNFLRHEVLPLLERRFPGTSAILARAAGWQAEAATAIDTLAAADLAACVAVGEGAPAAEGADRVTSAPPTRIALVPLLRLSPARQAACVRAFVRSQGLPMPAAAHLRGILTELIPAPADACPVVSWPGAEARRYRGWLYIQPPMPVAPASARVVATVLPWPSPIQPLALPWGRLEARPTVAAAPAPAAPGPAGPGLRAAAWAIGLTVAFRQGGEEIRFQGQQHHRSLKHHLQAAGVPPWERPFLPLVICSGRLVAVPGLGVAEGWAAAPGETGLALVWERGP